MKEELKNIILLGENVNTELKEASKGLPKVYSKQYVHF